MEVPIANDTEVKFPGGVMITETDTKGRITYVNRKFVNMSAYSKDELLGSPHSIMRHPDMPKCLFKNMWESLKKDQIWKGYVKNLRKDGAYYWVIVYVEPKFNENGEIVGYIAARKVPGEQTIEEIKSKYGELLDIESLSKEAEAKVVNIISEDLRAAI